VSNTFDHLITGDLGGTDRVLRGEIIAVIGQGAPSPATDRLDHRGRLILSGSVSRHMHTASAIAWPGVKSAWGSAATGGVTTCVDVLYDVPHAVTDACKLADKIGCVERTAHVDMALNGIILKSGGVGASPELVADDIPAFKLSTYEYGAVRFPRLDRAHRPTRRLARRGSGTGRTPDRGNARGPADRVDNALPHPPAAGRDDGEFGDIRDPPADRRAFAVAHSSLARGFALAEMFRGMGMQASGEACIQYLCMTEDDLVPVVGGGKCNPPFRTVAELMWTALAEDRVFCVSTDHSLWPPARKTLPDIIAWGAGLVGM